MIQQRRLRQPGDAEQPTTLTRILYWTLVCQSSNGVKPSRLQLCARWWGVRAVQRAVVVSLDVMDMGSDSDVDSTMVDLDARFPTLAVVSIDQSLTGP